MLLRQDDRLDNNATEPTIGLYVCVPILSFSYPRQREKDTTPLAKVEDARSHKTNEPAHIGVHLALIAFFRFFDFVLPTFFF